jgi:5'/3'-nucleotidase SurE
MRFIRMTLAIACVALTAGAAQAQGLNILLTNDDGYAAAGIQSMRVALEAAGHDVTLVAPLTNKSGSSAQIDLSLVAVLQVGANQFGVAGSPATCVLLGRTAIMANEPDLVVSGTNDGANTGTSTIFSGTVGAATAGLLSTPSLAFSTDPPAGTPAQIQQHFDDVANFAVAFIAHLQSKPGPLKKEEGLLPERLGLNINYPSLSPGEIAGIQLSAQGRTSNRDLIYQGIGPCPPVPGLPAGATCFIPAVIPADPGADVKDSDVEGLAAGLITVVPIDGDYTAPRSVGESLHAVLNLFAY